MNFRTIFLIYFIPYPLSLIPNYMPELEHEHSIEAIQAGDMNITVECNPRFGPIAFDTYEKFLKGEQIPPKIIVPDRFFDSSNAAQFVAEAY